MSTTIVVSAALTGAVERLRDRAKQQVNTEAIAQEMKNAQATSESQLRGLKQLEIAYAGAFTNALTIDNKALNRAGLNVDALFDSTREWLTDHVKWTKHHTDVVTWAGTKPEATVTVDEVVARIHAGEKSSAALQERAVALAGQFAKL
jgi:hypothetical protein